ncbi:unnamed protein product [Calypogeia fissa]
MGKLALMKVVVLLLLCSAGIVSEAAMLQDCSTQVSQLLPCLNFLSGSQSSPLQSCCDVLKAVDAAQPVCLCELIGYGAKLSLPSQMFNSTVVLGLPGLCNVGADPARCPALISGAPEGSPLPSGYQCELLKGKMMPIRTMVMIWATRRRKDLQWAVHYGSRSDISMSPAARSSFDASRLHPRALRSGWTSGLELGNLPVACLAPVTRP